MDEQTQLLQAILAELQDLHAAMKAQQPAPRLEFNIADYKDFPWEAIGATPAQADRTGVTVVWWGGRQFFKREPENRYGKAILFSRNTGQSDDGNAQYERLVRFSDSVSAGQPVPSNQVPRSVQQPRPQPQQPATATATAEQTTGTRQITREQWLARQKQRQNNAG